MFRGDLNSANFPLTLLAPFSISKWPWNWKTLVIFLLQEFMLAVTGKIFGKAKMWPDSSLLPFFLTKSSCATILSDLEEHRSSLSHKSGYPIKLGREVLLKSIFLVIKWVNICWDQYLNLLTPILGTGCWNWAAMPVQHQTPNHWQNEC